MIPACIQGANLTLGKPADLTDEECAPLRVRVQTVEFKHSRTHQFTSAWQPTPEELKRLNAGASVHLSIWGGGHPPVLLEVGPV